MKKIFKLFAAFAAVTMAFSCIEEANLEVGTQNGGSNYDGPMMTLTFSVDQLTKTSYDKDNGHQWSEGDQIKIIWGAEDNAYTVADVVNGKVSAQVGVADTYYAVYPETTAYTFTTPEGADAAQLTVAIPQTQDGSFKQANLMAAKTTLDELSFAFKNLTHIFKFTLSEDTAYKGFQFMSNSTSATITGAISVSFDEFAIAKPATHTIGGTQYTASSIVQVGNLLPGGTYYVGMYPGVDMQYGFGFKATKQEGTTGWSEGALLMGAVDTDRLKITSISNLDKAIRSNFFFKQTACGKGDGSDWENAGDVNLLVKLLGSELAEGVSYNKNTNAWRLYGAKLHLAAGTYEFPQTIAFQIAVNNKTAVYGGYPSNLTGTSLEGRDAAANETILTKDGGTRLFSSNGSTLYDWTWDGLIFTNNSKDKVSTDRGGIFYFNGSTKGTLKFKDCIFKNVKSTSGSGGAIMDFNTGTQTFKATFENCEFSNNECTKGHGGAILVESGSDAVIKFVNCDFTSNTVSGSSKSGGAIYNNSATIIVDNCSFVGNGKDASGKTTCYEGGAIYSIDSASSTDGTTPLSYLYIYNSYFTDNAASNQAGAIKAQGGGYMTMVNSTVSGNTTKNGSVRLRCAASNPTSANGMHAYLVNSTFADDAQSFYNQQSIAYIYNTVINKYYENGTAPIMNLYSSVMTEVAGGKTDIQAGYYNAAGAVDNTVTDFTGLLGEYANGIVPVGGIALTYGMTSTALSALATDIKAVMPLFDATKLTVDQKGNSREGKTIMGAYVGQ